MKRLPPLLLLSLVTYACPTPKAGDDRLIADSGVMSEDSGTPAPDGGSPSADGGPPAPDGGSMISDAGRDDGGGSPDSGTEGCVPTGPEDCTNGIDDDCQNGIDCADPACGACVPLPNDFALGVMVDATAACPPGFAAEETDLFAGLDQGLGCVGSCTCQPNPTQCIGALYIYATEAQCQGDTALTGGQPYGGVIDSQCTAMPVQEGFPGGFRIGNWSVQQSCSSSGVASPSPYTWGQRMKFCAAQAGLQGCDSTSACVPNDAAPDACLMTSGGAACPDPFSDRSGEWYTGLTDTRSCGPCECTASGGSCQFAQISLGSDWVCTDGAYVSQQSPTSCGSAYSPPARVTGSPQDPTCTSASQLAGSIEVTGQQTVCCQP